MIEYVLCYFFCHVWVCASSWWFDIISDTETYVWQTTKFCRWRNTNRPLPRIPSIICFQCSCSIILISSSVQRVIEERNEVTRSEKFFHRSNANIPSLFEGKGVELSVSIINIRCFSHFSKVDSLRRLAWNKTGPKQIEKAERRIFDTLKCHVEGAFVPISNNNQRIWTIMTNLKSKNIPLVLLHGFGGGVGLWSLNLDELCADRPVYAIDLPGFARSSRPVFSLDPIKAEEQFVKMIDEWRAAIGLNEPFILLGHSFGGFISAAYALRHPEYVKQLVLIDPWGFGRRPKNIWQTGRLQRIPTWLRSFSGIILKLSPLAGLRAAGPLGNLFNFQSRLHFLYSGIQAFLWSDISELIFASSSRNYSTTIASWSTCTIVMLSYRPANKPFERLAIVLRGLKVSFVFSFEFVRNASMCLS